MFPTATRPITCPNLYRTCVCDVCLPVHCPDCDKNFADIAAYELHIRLPCAKRWCGYCFAPFFRRLELIEHYESGTCKPDRFNRQATAKPSETTPLIPTTVDSRILSAPDLATQQSWNEETQRYKCYLCNPVRFGFHTLAGINEHLAGPDHKAKNYKCPHTACNLPFNTIGGLVQHVETRSCCCIIDSKWWNTHLALPRAGNRPWGTANDASPAHVEGEQMEEDSATLAELDAEDEMALEDFWVGRYFAMTGPDGKWDCEGDGFSTRIGVALAGLGGLGCTFVGWVGQVLLSLGGWVCVFMGWVRTALLLLPEFLKSLCLYVVALLTVAVPAFGLGVVLYYLFRFLVWLFT